MVRAHSSALKATKDQFGSLVAFLFDVLVSLLTRDKVQLQRLAVQAHPTQFRSKAGFDGRER